ncbi:MAG: hypothetical protein FWC01_00060 [Treponema sp.]|nr:hypothetical protein [Treponema sp.]MCL2236686.1 hypothetical protein [Treponema sp.]
MNKSIFLIFSCLTVMAFICCSPSVSPEDRILIAYEKYVDDMIAEYKKTDTGDLEAYKNIGMLSELGTDLKEQIRFADFNEEQREKLEKIEEKRKDFFGNR